MTRFALVFALLTPLWAGDTAVLVSGQRIEADRIERDGERFILHIGGGRIELDAAEVASVEHVPEPPAEVQEAVAEAPKRVLTPRELVTEAARRAGLPPEFVHSVARTVSAYTTNAVSP